MDFQKLLSLVEKNHGTEGRLLVENAHKFMKKAHEGQTRDGGDEYYTHPENVAKILAEQGHTDPELLAAALLHDVVEDTKYTLEDIQEQFGKIIRFLVNGVTNVGEGDGAEKIENKLERMKATYKKVLSLGQKDSRIFLIKVADRIHNLTTMDALSAEKKERIQTYSKMFYTDFAEKAGDKALKELLENLLQE